MAQLGDLIVSGKSRFLNKISGSCTNGTTVSSQSQTTKFLREDGEWAAPSYTTNVDTKVTQSPSTTNATYELLFSGSADNTEHTEGAKKSSNLTFNPAYSTATGTMGVLSVNGKDLSSNVSQMKIYPNDLIKSGTGNTWDGTNTSLVTAVTNAKDTVKQTVLSVGTNEYRLLLSGSADGSEHTEGVKKYSTLTFIPDDNASVYDGNSLSLYNNAWETVIRLSCGTSPYLHIKDSSTKYLRVTNTDVTLANSTWDGANTSLVTAIKKCIKCRQVQFSITSVNITKNTNTTILSQYNLKTSTATDLFSNQTLKALFGSTDIVGVKCTWINGGTALARDELIESGGLYTLGVYCTSLGGSTVNTIRLLVWYTL